MNLFVRSSSLVATAANINTEIRYKAVVAPMADRVPLGIDLCVSRKDAERFDPAIIPVTAGKNSPSSSLF